MARFETLRERRERLEKVSQDHVKTMAEVTGKVEDIKSLRLSGIQERYDAIKAEIQRLHDEKHELLRGAITKDELLEMSKQALKDYKRQEVMEFFLVPHLKKCRASGFPPFETTALHVTFDPDRAWRLFYLCVSEADIEAAVAQLPDGIGMPKAERDKKVKAIDAEIRKLASLAEKELAELQSAGK